MGSSAEHSAKWQSNREFLRAILDIETHPDWLLIVAFYAALHAAEAVLSADGHPCSTHAERRQVLRTVNRYKKIWEHYHPLDNGAWLARYDCSYQITASEARDVFIREHLLGVEKSVRKLLGLSVDLGPL